MTGVQTCALPIWTDWSTGKVLDLPTILDRPGNAAFRSHTGITISLFMYSFLSVVVVVVDFRNEGTSHTGFGMTGSGDRTVNQAGSPSQLMVLPLEGRL